MPKSADSVLSTVDGNGHPLPEEVFRTAYRRLLSTNGYVHLTDVPDTFDHVGFLRGFGQFLPGPEGMLVGDMIAEPGSDDVYHSGNRQALVPHTEGYDLEQLPPRYLSLWCVVPPAGHGGETTLLDGHTLLATLTPDERHHLETSTYRWTLAEGLRRQGMSYQADHPVLDTYDGTAILRFSYNNVARPDGDKVLDEFLERGNQLFDQQHVEVRYQPAE